MRAVLLFITVIFFIAYTQDIFKTRPYFVGEYPSAIFPVYSIVYEHSLRITSESFELAKKDMSTLSLLLPNMEYVGLANKDAGGGTVSIPLFIA